MQQEPRRKSSEVGPDEAAELMRGCLGTRVARLQRVVGRRFDLALRPLGLTLSQLEVLAALQLWAEPARPGEIAEVLHVERSTMSRNLALLERDGRVVPVSTSPSGRSMTVSLTAAGRRTLAEANSLWAGVQADLLDLLGPKAPATLQTWVAAASRLEEPVGSSR